MRFIVDENLPVALAQWLADRGFEAEHTRLLGLDTAPDRDIVRQAMRTDAVIVSKDSDYLTFARRDPAPQVIHVRSGNASSAQLLATFEEVWPQVISALRAGERVITVARSVGARS